MRNDLAILAGLLAVCCTSIPCNAAILVTETEALAETFGEVESPLEGDEPWAADDLVPGVGDVVASITGDPDAMAEILAAKGTGEADASVELLGGSRFRLAGATSVLLEQFAFDGEGFGESIAQSLLDFDLTTPGLISLVTAADGDVALVFDPLGVNDPVDLLAGTPLAIGSYQLAGTADAEAIMNAGEGDQFSEMEYLLDLTIASSGGIAVPEPSSVFAWVIFASVFGMRQLTRFRREG